MRREKSIIDTENRKRATWKGGLPVNMDLGLYQEQAQRLIMTQQMKQAIQLLQCTSEELNETLLEELNENPFIEYTPAPALAEASWTEVFRMRGPERRSSRGAEGPSRENLVELLARAELNMVDDLSQQLMLMNVPKEDVTNAIRLLGCINESGYLECGEEEGTRLCGGPEVYERAVALIQQCDPPGIGARNVQECLLLQANHLEGPLREWVVAIVSDHLKAVATGKFQLISKALKLSVQEVQMAVDCIRSLNPRPGSSLGANDARYVVPEVVVAEREGEYQVLLNDEAQPTIAINQTYAAFIRRRGGTANRYLNEQLQNARWLRKSLEQRQHTLYRVAQAIVAVQQDFFRTGPAGLRPLTLHQIAETVELHESTVSRTVRGKYMQTPRGIFELKYFFMAELQSTDGTVSAQSVKHVIRQLVDNEDTTHPLSDEALCIRMQSQGIRVSRRTIAKYRDELRIPSSAKRRRFV